MGMALAGSKSRRSPFDSVSPLRCGVSEIPTVVLARRLTARSRKIVEQRSTKSKSVLSRRASKAWLKMTIGLNSMQALYRRMVLE
jgi:hypothetical protein